LAHPIEQRVCALSKAVHLQKHSFWNRD